MEEPKPETIATLDNCSHIYCIACIEHWVDASESKCPQCKAVIGKITYKEDGIQIQKLVEERHQGMIDYNCSECRERIRPGNLVTGSGIDEAITCDLCERYAVHIRCMDTDAKENFDEEHDWLCGLCKAMLDIESSCSCCMCPNCMQDRLVPIEHAAV